MQKKVKAIVSDLDGTLLNSENRVGELDLKTLEVLGEKNIVRVLATGRSYYSFHKVLDDNFPIDYLLFCNGGAIMDFKTKEIIANHYIPANEVKIIVKRLNELKLDYQVRFKIPDGHKYFYKKFLNYNPDFERLEKIYKDFIFPLESIDSLVDSSRIICISPDKNITNELIEEFKDYCIIRATSPIDHKSVWAEIYPAGVQKGSSFTELCKKLNIDISETVGLGNDYNDIDFLNITGQSYIVSNAPQDLKKKYIETVSNDENPLSYILNGQSKIPLSIQNFDRSF